MEINPNKNTNGHKYLKKVFVSVVTNIKYSDTFKVLVNKQAKHQSLYMDLNMCNDTAFVFNLHINVNFLTADKKKVDKKSLTKMILDGKMRKIKSYVFE